MNRRCAALSIAVATVTLTLPVNACDDHLTLKPTATVGVGYTPVGPLPVVPEANPLGDRFDIMRCCATDQQIIAGAAIHTATTPFAGVFSSNRVDLLSNVPLANMGGGAGSSLYGWVDPLTKREYAIMGRSNGTAFVDVTDPYNPKYVANLPLAAGSVPTSWREPKVFNNHAYIGVDGTSHGMQVLNLAKLRTYTGTTLNLTADTTFSGVTKIHTLAVNPATGFLYAAGTNKYAGGIMAINVNNPLVPVDTGGFSGDGYTHETQVLTYHGPDAAYFGKEIAFNSNAKSGAVADTFSIVDYTSKTAPIRLSTRTYTGARYIHQGWLTEDHRFFFQNDEADENATTKTRTHLWDVSDLNNPVYRGFYSHQTNAVDHNLYVKGDYLYEANYTTGLRIFKIGNLAATDPTRWLTEVAFFDTYPTDDSTTFNGAWNNYPYLPSGNVLVSDINGGLFVLRPQLGPGYGNGLEPPTTGSDLMTLSLIPEPASAAMLMLLCLPALARRRRAGSRSCNSPTESRDP